MHTSITAGTPEWVARFLAALRDGQGARAAARAAGVTSSTPYNRRTRDDAFRAAWDAIKPVDGRKARHAGPRRPRGAARHDRFLGELAETSNVAAAAAVAGLSTGTLYKLRRSDPEFARRWYAALAEGYDNLEMELLGRLRAGESADAAGPGAGAGAGAGEGAAKVKFDTAAALRCLAAHRESVAREKGRRTLAAEVATIAAINARIDEMRLKQQATRRAVAKARRAATPQVAKDAPGHG
jgi:hypothetical protein